MRQYVTLVSKNEIVLGKSHIRREGRTDAVAVWCQCGIGFSGRDSRVRITNTPECRGVCKSCERMAL